MDYKNKLTALIKENNGLVTTKDVERWYSTSIFGGAFINDIKAN